MTSTLERFATRRKHSRYTAAGMAVFAALLLVGSRDARAQIAAGGVLTQHVDAARTGLNPLETQLTWANVPTSFGKLFTVPVTGRIFAQPLFVPQVPTFVGIHDLVIVATEANVVYAIEAHTGGVFWSRTLGTPIPSADAYASICTNIVGGIGITGTPVIDPATTTLYLVSASKSPDGTYHQALYALDVATGTDRAGSPMPITATYPGDGPAAVSGLLTFDPLRENQRAGLLLMGGQVYVSWAGHCDDFVDFPNPQVFFGWVMSFDAGTLARTHVFNAAPHADPAHTSLPYGASIWHGGGGLASDGNRIYANTGNGLFQPSAGDYGDSVLALSPALQVQDYFAPFDQAFLDRQDLDFSGGGVVVVPTGVAQHPNLLVTTGKEGTIYLLDRSSLGGAQPTTGDVICPSGVPASGCVVGRLFQAVGAPANLSNNVGAYFGIPAYFNGRLYFAGNGDSLKAFSVGGATPLAGPLAQTTTTFNYPGSTPSISANGTSDAIVWALERTQPFPFQFPDPTHLHAYRADTLAELYNSSAPGQDPDGAAQFITPTIAGGQVYVGTATSLAVYGLYVGATPAVQTVGQGSSTSYAITTGATGAQLSLSMSGLPAGATATFTPASLQSGTGSTLSIAAAVTTPPGSYTLTIAASDGTTTHVTSVTLVVLHVDQPPTADFTVTCNGRQCAFDGTLSSDLEGPIASYSWDFGDGSAAGAGATPNHLYAVSGTYKAVLTVTDSAGQTARRDHKARAIGP
jgi:PKD domain